MAPLAVRGGGASYTFGYLPQTAGHVLLDLGGLDRIVTIEAVAAKVVAELRPSADSAASLLISRA